MHYVIAVFNSRFSTLNFSNFLKQNNVPCAIINTPSNIKKTCGISVKFQSGFLNKIRTLLGKQGRLRNFDGLYLLSGEKIADRLF